MATSRLQKARDKDQLQLVQMNQAKYLRFEPKAKTCLGTENLNACTAVVIVSRYAAILGHFSPRPSAADANTATGDAHIKTKMDELHTLLAQHLGNSAQKPSSISIVVYAVYMGTTALQNQKELIEAQLKVWKMPFISIPYQVLENRERRGPAKGTVLIDPRDGATGVYVEDKLVIEIKAAESSTVG
ncbi:MAG: hypothetical protein Q9217_000722 [Psora testacea]